MSNQTIKTQAQFPKKLRFLFEPHRYKVAYGGRGGAKSWGFARALLIQGMEKPLRMLCARETQKSISESVHLLLRDQISEMGIGEFYRAQSSKIEAVNGSLFAFAGIRQNVGNIKSFEGFDRVWIEEAQNVSQNSWDVLIPTIRKEESEIWLTFNPELESDVTYQRFVVNPPQNAHVVKINWQDNPWFPPVLRKEMEDLRQRDPIACDNVYEGICKQAVEGAVYREQLTSAEADGRITRVPYDSTHLVHTFWDLGFGDETTIWFAQSIGFEFRIIDYLHGSLLALPHYLKQLSERPYVYAAHYLPHDAKAHELGTGRSIEEQAKESLGKDKVKVVKKLSIEDGIAAVRAIFSRCYFDREKCADGMQALRHYRYAKDDERGTFSSEPLHDWASHGADGFRTLAVAIKEGHKPKEQERRYGSPNVSGSGTGWMR